MSEYKNRGAKFKLKEGYKNYFVKEDFINGKIDTYFFEEVLVRLNLLQHVINPCFSRRFTSASEFFHRSEKLCECIFTFEFYC